MANKSKHKAKREPEYDASEATEHSEGCQKLADEIGVCLKQYARDNPGTTALWCLGIGFVLGWKMKPW